MRVETYDNKNKKSGAIDLPDNIFGVKWNPDLVHQVVVSVLANRRKPIAHAKDRSEVSGGGKKPWRQKGTGRARHGSSRSPLWTGGGATFGPRNEKQYTKKINKKMKRAALFSVLSKKLSENEIKIIDNFEIKDAKTKNAAAMIREFTPNVKDQKKKPKTLLVPAQGSKNVITSGRNIVKNKVSYPNDLNIYECLAHKLIFFEKPAVEEFIKQHTAQESRPS